MKLRKALLSLLLCCATFTMAHAQVAGINTLSVLNMSSSARSSALSMPFLAAYDTDLGLALDNPSLINDRLHNNVSFNYVGMFGGTHFGSFSYGLKTSKIGTLLLGIQFLNYGRFDRYDEFDNPQGQFSAADYVLNIGWGLTIDSNFSIGATLKPILSQYESYTALAMAIDVAGSYVSDSRRFASSLVARNIGAQLMTFDGAVEGLPFRLGATMSYKLENAPFRIFLSAMDLQQWNLLYEDPLNPSSTTDMFGEVHTTSKTSMFFDNLMRHALVGVELSLGKAFYARLGYNYRQSREIKSATLESFNTSGFSYGIGFRVKGFDFAYARNNYHLGQAPNYISITTNLDRFFK